MSTVKRQHRLSLLATAAAWTLTVLAFYAGQDWLHTHLKLPYLNWEYASQDAVARKARPAPVAPEVFFLAIDPASHSLDQLWDDEIAASPTLQLMKKRTWSRQVYADMIDRLADAGAKVVAFDVIFPAPDDGDDALREALDRHKEIAIIGTEIEQTGVGRSINAPAKTILPKGIENEDRIGFVNTWPDEDDIVRRARFHMTREELSNIPTDEKGDVFHSLAARMSQKGGYGDRIPADSLPHLFRYAYQSETLLASQKPPSVYQIFAAELWQKNFGNGAFFRGKIVLIGPEGRSNKDTLGSPFGQIAGADFHLNALNAVITRQFLRQTPLAIDFVIVAGGGLIAWALGRFVRQPGLRLGLLVISIPGWFAVCIALYDADWVVPVFSPCLALAGSGALFSIVEQILDRLEKAKLRQTFERYVSKDVVKELVDNPEGWLNALVGQRKPITILFSDVRGFTTLTESADPHALVAQLNEYFDDMVEIVFRNNGTLDKFIGDAVMAHWGSIRTEGIETDARRAVATAVQMRKALAKVNPEWKARGMLELQFGIGVNHGEAIVGNLGSKEKAEVSVISDAVNLASRLEGVTKQYHIDLCIGEHVAPLVRDAFLLRSLDLIVVKGKTKPVEIFAVLDERSPGIPEPAWLPRHEEAVKLYRAGDFPAAEAAWREVLAQSPGDRIAEVFIARCTELRATPPPGEWDGVFEMKSK